MGARADVVGDDDAFADESDHAFYQKKWKKYADKVNISVSEAENHWKNAIRPRMKRELAVILSVDRKLLELAHEITDVLNWIKKYMECFTKEVDGYKSQYGNQLPEVLRKRPEKYFKDCDFFRPYYDQLKKIYAYFPKHIAPIRDKIARLKRAFDNEDGSFYLKEEGFFDLYMCPTECFKVIKRFLQECETLEPVLKRYHEQICKEN